jgi:hypothetical protein
MYNDNLISNTIYPKSNNHKITWKKNDNIKTCDLNTNCTEIIFDIKQNKNIKIINDISPIIDKLPTGNPPVYEMFNLNYKILGLDDFIYNIVSLILLVILIVILVCKK